MSKNEYTPSGISHVHSQPLDNLNGSCEEHKTKTLYPHEKNTEIISISHRADTPTEQVNSCETAKNLSMEMAVVPFVSLTENNVNLGTISRSSALTSTDITVASRGVCPTCLRPFCIYDTSTHKKENIEQQSINKDFSSFYPPWEEERPMLTSAYFRMLSTTMPLAINDTPHVVATQQESGITTLANIQRHKYAPVRKKSRNSKDKQSENTENGTTIESPRDMSLCYYLSPTDSIPRDYVANKYDVCGTSFSSHPRAPTIYKHKYPTNQRCTDEKCSAEPSRTHMVSHGDAGKDTTLQKLGPSDDKNRNSLFNAVTGLDGYYARYFIELQKLGSGTYGGVYLCQHVMEGVPLGTFALKKVPVGDNITYLQKVLHEVRILEEVNRHPNVVEYNHSWVETAQLADFGPPVRCLFILMEYATEGSLDVYMERYGTALSTLAVWYFFLSAVAGTAHLHRKNILHRDLKPQNLLLTGPTGTLPRVLVSDFGTAALLGDLGYERTGGTGTLEYMAPELLECTANICKETYLNRHTKASDTWSLGMILYYLACNATLPQSLPNGSLSLDVEAHSPYTRPPEMVQLIQAMLQRNPMRRPSCENILQSTVAQTILRTFNSQTKIPQVHLHSQYVESSCSEEMLGYNKFSIKKTPQPQSFQSTKDSDDDYGDGSNLECSKVQLVSSSAMMNIPLLMQYHTNDTIGTRCGGSGSREIAEESMETKKILSIPQSSLLPNVCSAVKKQPNNIQNPTLTIPRNVLSATWTPSPSQIKKMLSKSVQTDSFLSRNV